jgi:sirohydrochlorin ferrochelatase
MKPAIVLVDHGSRRAEANAVLDAVAEQVRAAEPGRIVHVAHMELAAPTLAEAVDACVADGARAIVVHPYFLAPGHHSTRDIPRLAAQAAARHDGVDVRVSAPLGVHAKLAEVVLERVRET